ncbi:polysaccharide deacetylase family protein [Angustibacter luteus]|uniref:Polysaccharide deacetylase family protein n=1 Tax=Angustibacter luteus TaxID=658456 RepID=A0ABW1JFI9_9ACTN
MRKSWGRLRRPRTVVLVALMLAALAASAPTAGASLGRHHGTSSTTAAEHAPSAHLPVGLPATSPTASTPTSSPTSTPTSSPTASPLPTGGTPTSPQQRPDVVYLTFDDGPDPHWTPQILALLDRYHVRATFFEIGDEVRRHPRTAALVRAAGQPVGSHTSHHRNLTKLAGTRLIREITGGPAGATCLRPPFGAVDAHVRQVAAAQGQSIVLWNVDTDDWAKPGTASIERELLRHARPGRTVLMHDGGGNRAQTLAALKVVLPKLVARGYRFDSVPGC